MMANETMSDARLAEIRETAQQAGWMYAESDNEAYGLYSTVEELLAEVERLRAREAALVVIVRQVAHTPEGVPLVPVYVTPDVFKQARALLADDARPDAPGRE